ncbi:hypothetical protein HEK616_27150 [Streptomyces nigrescens]|uniref:Uncharacterized protein n=1 Tax=Streptomyces nigrescens TaxID=1920 RepID=A0ABM7ZS79_STRNI|nr:hypothetical protein HEK616_27150 [Streptomyces nigrescens]
MDEVLRRLYGEGSGEAEEAGREPPAAERGEKDSAGEEQRHVQEEINDVGRIADIEQGDIHGLAAARPGTEGKADDTGGPHPHQAQKNRPPGVTAEVGLGDCVGETAADHTEGQGNSEERHAKP